MAGSKSSVASPARVTVAVSGGTIAAIEPFDTDLPAASTITLRDDEVLLPGMVDTHVHVNEPGRTEWEGFATATRAAAAGGAAPFTRAPSMAKPLVTESATWIAHQCLQIHGGYGYVSDFPVERIWRDVRVCQIYEGTSDIQRILIGRALATGPG